MFSACSVRNIDACASPGACLNTNEDAVLAQETYARLEIGL